MTAAHVRPEAIAQQLSVSQPTVRKWRLRYVQEGLVGLRNEPRPGRPRSLDDQQVADLLNRALQTRPAKQTHWSVRSFGAEAAISKDMAHRLFRAAGIAPHRSRSCYAWTKKVRYRLWSVRSRYCPWGGDMWKASPTITFAMARQRCLPPWTPPTAK